MNFVGGYNEYFRRLEITSRMKKITYMENGMSKVDLSAEETNGEYIEITPLKGTNMVRVSTYKYNL